MIKFLLVCAVIVTATACQQKPNARPPEPTPAPKVGDLVAGQTSKTTTNCNATFTVKTYAEDGTETVTNYESKTQFAATSKFISEEANGFRKYETSGSMVYEENKINPDDTKVSTGNSDYSYAGTRSTKVTETAENTFEREDIKKDTRTGRNGYKFRNKDKVEVDSLEVESTNKRVYFDDGQQEYTISHTINGKDVMVYNYDTLTKYTETKNGNKVVTNSTSSLRAPLVTKDNNGKIVEETTSFEEQCTGEYVKQ